MTEELGLRERKKRETRQAIRQAALQLFAERGFEAVTVTEVARVANVSQATVFNYFPTKEDLFYERMEVFEEELLGAVRFRKAGETVLCAFRDFVLNVSGVLAESQSTERLAMFARIVQESPALREREEQIFSHYTESLAALIAAERDAGTDDIRPWVVANALIGVHRGLLNLVRRQALAGCSSTGISRAVQSEGERAFQLLADGLGTYDLGRA